MNPADDDRSVMTAVTFAEAGEWGMARQYAPPWIRRRVGSWIERHLLAAVFAEEGLHEEALRLYGAAPSRPTPRDEDALNALNAHLRSPGVRMFYGALSPAALAARR